MLNASNKPMPSALNFALVIADSPFGWAPQVNERDGGQLCPKLCSLEGVLRSDGWQVNSPSFGPFPSQPANLLYPSSQRVRTFIFLPYFLFANLFRMSIPR